METFTEAQKATIEINTLLMSLPSMYLRGFKLPIQNSLLPQSPAGSASLSIRVHRVDPNAKPAAIKSLMFRLKEDYPEKLTSFNPDNFTTNEFEEILNECTKKKCDMEQEVVDILHSLSKEERLKLFNRVNDSENRDETLKEVMQELKIETKLSLDEVFDLLKHSPFWWQPKEA